MVEKLRLTRLLFGDFWDFFQSEFFGEHFTFNQAQPQTLAKVYTTCFSPYCKMVQNLSKS